MSDFEVCTDDLRSLMDQLSSLLNELGQAGQIQPAVDAAGHPLVEMSLESFLSDWSDGFNKVQANMSKLSDKLKAAADGYDGTEQSITDALTGG